MILIFKLMSANVNTKIVVLCLQYMLQRDQLLVSLDAPQAALNLGRIEYSIG